MKRDTRNAANLRGNITNSRDLDIYSVAATLYGEAGNLDNKGIIRVAETIRNRYEFYNKNRAQGVNKISYRDIVIAPNQYLGFNSYKKMKVSDFREFEKKLSDEERKNWNRCMIIAQRTVNSQLKTNYARGAVGFNKASIESNKKMFDAKLVFKDDSCYINNATKKSPHVFIGDLYMSPLKTPQGKLLAKGGNPSEGNTVFAQVRRFSSRVTGSAVR
ncbi:MAG: hypothetical protein IJ532_06500 [Alphaproteobacteria bacterium]|nr:hypothetical protein [Alphaproteobacteria bacterium]